MYKLILGDCLEEMKKMEPNSIDSAVCDPPYGLGFMNKEWDNPDKEKRLVKQRNTERKKKGLTGSLSPMRPGMPILGAEENRKFQEWCYQWAKEIYRILKPGAYLLSFGATRMYHRMASGIEDAGFTIRDQIGWTFGSGFPKSLNLKGEHDGWGTALKPAWEPIVMARKALEGTVAQNVEKYGTGAINIDASRIGYQSEKDKEGAKFGKPQAKSFAMGESGFGKLPDNYRSSDVGRWPANLIHDGSDEVMGLFPKSKSTLDKSEINRGTSKSWFTGDNVDRIQRGDSGSAARFFYCAKASKADRDEGLEAFEQKQTTDGNIRSNPDSARKYQANSVARRNAHPTVKPTTLMRYLVRMVTPPRGVVLDPFMGSGSTGKACKLEGFSFIGIEKEEEYIKIAEARIAAIPETLFK